MVIRDQMKAGFTADRRSPKELAAVTQRGRAKLFDIGFKSWVIEIFTRAFHGQLLHSEVIARLLKVHPEIRILRLKKVHEIAQLFVVVRKNFWRELLCLFLIFTNKSPELFYVVRNE